MNATSMSSMLGTTIKTGSLHILRGLSYSVGEGVVIDLNGRITMREKGEIEEIPMRMKRLEIRIE